MRASGAGPQPPAARPRSRRPPGPWALAPGRAARPRPQTGGGGGSPTAAQAGRERGVAAPRGWHAGPRRDDVGCSRSPRAVRGPAPFRRQDRRWWPCSLLRLHLRDSRVTQPAHPSGGRLLV